MGKYEIKLCSLCIQYESFKDTNQKQCGCKKDIWKLTPKTWKDKRFTSRLDHAKECKYFKPKSLKNIKLNRR